MTELLAGDFDNTQGSAGFEDVLIDFDELVEEQQDKILPVGEYVVKVIGMTEKLNPDKNSRGYMWELQIVEGPHKGEKLNNYTYYGRYEMQDDKVRMTDISNAFSFRHILKCMGLLPGISPEAFEQGPDGRNRLRLTQEVVANRLLKVTVDHRTFSDQFGDERKAPDVKSVMPYDKDNLGARWEPKGESLL